MSATQLNEMAIACGRKKQSAQTGYVHFFYNSQEDEIQQTIPLVENFLFALALFRSKTAENILEAKGIIDRLLEFQCLDQESGKGNFPIYLHEYPQCKDRFLGAHLLPPFFWILKNFQQVLGSELKIKLEKAAKALLLQSLKTHEEKPAPYFIGLKIAAAARALGMLWEDKYLQDKGDLLLEEARNGDLTSLYIPSQMGEICAALQMAFTNISSSWIPFWEHLNNTWHQQCCSYIGPAIQEFQRGEESEPTLYDLFLGSFSGNFSQRSFSDQFLLLHGALIQKTEDRLPPPTYPIEKQVSIGSHKWMISKYENYAYCYIDNTERQEINREKGFSPLKIIWGDQKKTHTFVCQGANISDLKINKQPEGIDLFFTLGEIPTEDKEKSREVAFYFDAHHGTQIYVSKHASTTFKLDEEIEIAVEKLKFSIVFELLEGNGQFLGHIMRGNRPAQTGLKGSNRYKAYDWQVFLRTVRRSQECKIKASIKINSDSSLQ